MKIHKKTHILLFIAVFLLCGTTILAQSSPAIRNKPRLEWTKIDGASGYMIEIRRGGTRLIKTETKNNYYEPDLPHGVYQFRVSVLNEDHKVVERTGWETVRIQSWNIVGKKYQYIGAGWSYNIVVPRWNETITFNPLNAHLYYQYELPQLTFLGLEASIEYERYDPVNDSDVILTDLAVWSFAPGVCFYTRMSRYFDGLFHLSGGAAFSELNTDDNGTKDTYRSFDIYAEAALGLRLTYDMFYLEHGLGFKHIFYQNESLREVRPYIRAGVRF